MCLGDWRFGRLIRSQPTGFSLGVGQSLTIPPNTNRVGISIGMAQSPVAYQADITVGGVLVFSASQFQSDFLHFTLLTHGDLPTRQWVITRIGGTAVGGVVEYFATASELAAALQAFNSEYGDLLQHSG